MKSLSEQNEHIPHCFYRVSTKALILNETRTKFLIVQESNGKWEFPGGGLDYGSGAPENVTRELQEEMQVQTTQVAKLPSYVMTSQHDRTGSWIMNMFYETEVQDLDFVPSRECNACMFVDKDSLPELVYSVVPQFAEIFDPHQHHIKKQSLVNKIYCNLIKKYYDAAILRLTKKSMAHMEKEEFIEEMREYVIDILMGYKGVEAPELLNELYEECEGMINDAHDEMIHEVIERLGGEVYDPSVEEDDYEEESDEGDY